MVRFDVAARVDPHRLGQSQKPCVFTGTVVVQAAGYFVCEDQLGGIFHSLRPLRTAFQIILVQPGLKQHHTGGVCMNFLAIVRRTGKRQFGIGQIKGFCGA